MAVTTVYSVPDDGRKGLPKQLELLTPNKGHKKLHLFGIYTISKTLFYYYPTFKILLLINFNFIAYFTFEITFIFNS